MQSGLLIIESSLSHPGLVRIRAMVGPVPAGAFSEGPSADPSIRYVVRFNDLDAARLHAFTALRYHLVDLDLGLFRVPLETAVAKVESIALPHSLVHFDPDLRNQSGERIALQVAKFRRRHEVRDLLWQIVGWIAAAWLLSWALLGL